MALSLIFISQKGGDMSTKIMRQTVAVLSAGWVLWWEGPWQPHSGFETKMACEEARTQLSLIDKDRRFVCFPSDFDPRGYGYGG